LEAILNHSEKEVQEALTKQSKEEIVYNIILNNPEISKSSKSHLIRNTKN
jgi:hypothetical protein